MDLNLSKSLNKNQKRLISEGHPSTRLSSDEGCEVEIKEVVSCQ
jgi:hypothetical protein